MIGVDNSPIAEELDDAASGRQFAGLRPLGKGNEPLAERTGALGLR